MKLDSSLFNFLDELKNNNNRIWFKERKPDFDRCNKQVKLYFQSIFDNTLLIAGIGPVPIIAGSTAA